MGESVAHTNYHVRRVGNPADYVCAKFEKNPFISTSSVRELSSFRVLGGRKMT